MATVYVRSTDGDDGDDGSTWALADATLVASLVAAGAGGRSYMSDNHAESQASAMTLASPGTIGAITEVICGDDAAEPPTAVAATGTVTTTGNNAMTFTGSAYYYGITFTAGSGGTTPDMNINVNNANHTTIFDNCVLALAGTNSAAEFVIGGPGGQAQNPRIQLLDTDLSFGAAGSNVELAGCHFLWRGGTILGTAPTTLIMPPVNVNVACIALIDGVDLSPLGSGNLVNVAQGPRLAIKFVNCKLGASAVIVSGAWPHRGSYVMAVNCDSADTNYRFYFDTYEGTISHETTIVRTGGASDGTTGFSRKMASTAGASFSSPLFLGSFDCQPLLVWNETTGSAVTLTVETVTDNVTLTDAEAWIEVEYLGTSGFPIASFASDRAADILATPANQTSSSETWTTTGLTTPVKQKLSKAVTPAEKGWIAVRVMLAKASTTIFFCPKVDVS